MRHPLCFVFIRPPVKGKHEQLSKGVQGIHHIRSRSPRSRLCYAPADTEFSLKTCKTNKQLESPLKNDLHPEHSFRGISISLLSMLGPEAHSKACMLRFRPVSQDTVALCQLPNALAESAGKHLGTGKLEGALTCWCATMDAAVRTLCWVPARGDCQSSVNLAG